MFIARKNKNYAITAAAKDKYIRRKVSVDIKIYCKAKGKYNNLMESNELTKLHKSL